jgi:hypothetical protein
MKMGDWYFFINQLKGICVRIKIKGPTCVGGIWTLCGLWKGIRKWITIILVWRVFKEIERIII